MKFYNRYQKYVMMSPAGDDGGSGGGDAPPKDTPPAPNEAMEKLQASNEALMKRLEALEGGATPPKEDPPTPESLAEKAKLEREAKEKSQGDSKTMESALKFTLQSATWIKDNAALLPESVEGIFEQAEKENYDSAIDKASAIKVGIVSEFFAQQTNLDLLTESQKNSLAEFQKLTKNEKESRVSVLYDGVFEPTFENLKRVKKAEQVSKGLGDPSGSESAYSKKMQELARKKYLGEK